MEKRYDNALTPDSFKFGQVDGFAIAAAYVDLRSDSDGKDHPEIGAMKFYMKSWDD